MHFLELKLQKFITTTARKIGLNVLNETISFEDMITNKINY